MKLNLPNSVAAAFAVLFAFFLLIAFAYGVAVVRYKLFPYRYVGQVEEAVRWSLDTVADNRSWYYEPTERTETSYIAEDFADREGLNLVTAMGPDKSLALKVVDMRGELVHEWSVDWFETWPNPDHLPANAVPQTRPGTHIHGAKLLPNGDIVFNYEMQGSVRMNACGDVLWRLPYQTHHSVHLDDDGVFWMSGVNTRSEKLAKYPNHIPPIRETTIVKVSQEGELLEEFSVFDLLDLNGQRALLHMRSVAITNKIIGDSLHLNDVEVFPANMAEGFFSHGDVLVSLRNINSIAVFDKDWRLKMLKVGGFVRQHDPDFVDGNTIMLFDNNNIGPRDFGQQSRILLLDAPTGELTEYYVGTPEQPFYTHIMGKQQLLENGHLLITDSVSGRGFEIDVGGHLVWEYINIVEPGIVGIVEEVERIPGKFREVFEAANCEQAQN